MSIYFVTTSEIRTSISRILAKVKKEAAPFYITKSGKPAAVILDVNWYQAMMNMLEDVDDSQDSVLAKRIIEARKSYQKTGGVPID